MFNPNLVELPHCKTLTSAICKKLFPDKESLKGWVIQEKVDGHRKFLIRNSDGTIGAYGRKYSSVSNNRENYIFKVGDRIRDYAGSLPPGTIIDGELYIPGEPAAKVATALSDESDILHYKAFGILVNEYSEFTGGQTQCFDLLSSFKIPRVKQVFLCDVVSDPNNVYEYCKSITEKEKWEGVIIKKDSISLCYKYKAETTYDVVVTGFKMAKKGKTDNMKGLIGSLICAASVDGNPLEVVCAVSGMTMKERREFSKNIPIGEVIEVKTQGITHKGKLRHPRFVRLRPDKDASMCNIETR